MPNLRNPWDVPADPVEIVDQSGPDNDEADDRRREPTLARDGYDVRSRRPHCARPGEIMSNERATEREKFDEEYGSAGIYRRGRQEMEE
jgi:hypothetical protein